jgi:hypothetical protein
MTHAIPPVPFHLNENYPLIPPHMQETPFGQFVSLQKVYGVMPEEASGLFDGLFTADINGAGISSESFIEMMEGFGVAREPALRMWTVLDGFDGKVDNVVKADPYGAVNAITIANKIEDMIDLDHDGVVGVDEYNALTGAKGHHEPVPALTADDHQASRYVIPDMEPNERVDISDHTLWDRKVWQPAHNGISFFRTPGAADARCKAIAADVVARGKTFTVFGEDHMITPWQEVGETIRAFRAAGKPVIYAVEYAAVDSAVALKACQDACNHRADLADPVKMKALVVELMSLLPGNMDKGDCAYTLGAAIRDGAEIAFIDGTQNDKDTRDETQAKALAELHRLHPDAAIVAQVGGAHASRRAAEAGRAEWSDNNVDKEPMVAKLARLPGGDSVFTMSFGQSNTYTGTGGEEVFDAYYGIPLTTGFGAVDYTRELTKN